MDLLVNYTSSKHEERTGRTFVSEYPSRQWYIWWIQMDCRECYRSCKEIGGDALFGDLGRQNYCVKIRTTYLYAFERLCKGCIARCQSKAMHINGHISVTFTKRFNPVSKASNKTTVLDIYELNW